MSRIQNRILRAIKNPFLAVVGLILVGGGVLFAQANMANFKFEAEQGDLSQGVVTGSDASASGGSYLSFTDQQPVSGCPLANAVFCENFESGPSTFVSRTGDWNPQKFSANRFSGNVSGAHMVPRGAIPSCRPGSEATPFPPGESLVCQPNANIQTRYGLTSAIPESYGLNNYRINQPFDISGRTGTLQFDASLNTPPSALLGYLQVSFTSEPHAVPDTYIPNGRGAAPKDGVVVQFWARCGDESAAPGILTYNDFRETQISDPGGNDACTQGHMINRTGYMNRFTFKISQTRIEIWATDYSSDGINFPASKLIMSKSINLNFTRGYLNIGSHNHSTRKYGGIASWTVLFDNISFDGPSIAADRMYQAADNNSIEGDQMRLGRTIPASFLPLMSPIEFQNVNVSGATSARISMSSGVNGGTSTPGDKLMFEYRLNGGPWHQRFWLPGEIWAFTTPAPDGFSRTNFGSTNPVFDVPISELVNGTNTIQFRHNSAFTSEDISTTIANIDLLLR